jgi:fumarylacetoacetate (FAA) hydrolase family protein
MLSTAAMLPADAADATLVGRLLLDEGPTPVLIRGGAVEDVSRAAPTVSDLIEFDDPASVRGEFLFSVEDLPVSRLLAPVDLQAVKAAGVTFAISAIERVIEERARGDYRLAASIRDKL